MELMILGRYPRGWPYRMRFRMRSLGINPRDLSHLKLGDVARIPIPPNGQDFCRYLVIELVDDNGAYLLLDRPLDHDIPFETPVYIPYVDAD